MPIENNGPILGSWNNVGKALTYAIGFPIGTALRTIPPMVSALATAPAGFFVLGSALLPLGLPSAVLAAGATAGAAIGVGAAYVANETGDFILRSIDYMVGNKIVDGSQKDTGWRHVRDEIQQPAGIFSLFGAGVAAVALKANMETEAGKPAILAHSFTSASMPPNEKLAEIKDGLATALTEMDISPKAANSLAAQFAEKSQDDEDFARAKTVEIRITPQDEGEGITVSNCIPVPYVSVMIRKSAYQLTA